MIFKEKKYLSGSKYNKPSWLQNQGDVQWWVCFLTIATKKNTVKPHIKLNHRRVEFKKKKPTVTHRLWFCCLKWEKFRRRVLRALTPALPAPVSVVSGNTAHSCWPSLLPPSEQHKGTLAVSLSLQYSTLSPLKVQVHTMKSLQLELVWEQSIIGTISPRDMAQPPLLEVFKMQLDRARDSLI